MNTKTYDLNPFDFILCKDTPGGIKYWMGKGQTTDDLCEARKYSGSWEKMEAILKRIKSVMGLKYGQVGDDPSYIEAETRHMLSKRNSTPA